MSRREGVSRRDLLRRGFRNVLQSVAGSLDGLAEKAIAKRTCDPADAGSTRYRQAFPVLRPPGALEESAFLDGCTKCEACIEACPHDAIIKAPARFRRAAETPMIDPARQPCLMCADFPCIAACEPRVLRYDLPKRMGTARIEPFACLAYQGSFCTVCAEHCPVDGALELTEGRPRILEEVCTGCGVCQHVCPAPINAVLLMPLTERPGPPLEEQEMPTPNQDDLPELSDAVLGAEELAALFRDYRHCVTVQEILVKTRPRDCDDGKPPTLDETEAMLRQRAVRGVQVRYDFDGTLWCDTLMVVPNGIRLVRIEQQLPK